MINLRDDPYTENDVKESIDSGNIYIIPNIKGTFETINKYEFKSATLSLYDITPGTLSCNISLELTDTESFIRFKDGSYIRVECTPSWTLLQLDVLRFEWYFGLMDEGTEAVTEYRMGGVTGLPTHKDTWRKSYDPIQGEVWLAGDPIAYKPGDLFHFALSWAPPEFIPHFRYIIIPYLVGGEYSALNWYNSLNPNIMQSGIQYGIDVSSVNGQIFAAYLCGYSTEGTEYPGEDSTEGGGHGEFYNENEDVDFPAIPSLQAIDLGFTTLYNPHESDVRAIAAWLWSDDFVQNIKMNYTDPLNNILGINFCPLPEGLINNEMAEFIVGNTSSGISTLKVTPGNKNQYVELDCGERVLPEYWQNFLDYNSSFMIWLPFIGFRQLRPDDILQETRDTGGSLKVKYIIDLLTGCAVCNIISVLKDRLTNKLVKHLLYSYTCNVFYSTPLSGANYMSMYNQQLNATASGISNLVSSIGQMASGNVGGAVSGLVNLFTGQAQAQRQYETAKPEYGRSGNSGGNSGYFSFKKPYIIKTNPIGQTPKNYNSLEGVPSMIYSKLSKLEGYTEINTINLDSLNASSAEKSELLTIMKSGFYI